MMNRTLILLLINALCFTACSRVNTDALLPHQIIAAPKNKWVGIEEETPLDVSEAHQVRPITCTEPRAE